MLVLSSCSRILPVAGQNAPSASCALTVNASNCTDAELVCSSALSQQLSNESATEGSCEDDADGPSCVDGLQVAKLLLWDLTGFNLPCSVTDAAANFVLLVV